MIASVHDYDPAPELPGDPLSPPAGEEAQYITADEQLQVETIRDDHDLTTPQGRWWVFAMFLHVVINDAKDRVAAGVPRVVYEIGNLIELAVGPEGVTLDAVMDCGEWETLDSSDGVPIEMIAQAGISRELTADYLAAMMEQPYQRIQNIEIIAFRLLMLSDAIAKLKVGSRRKVFVRPDDAEEDDLFFAPEEIGGRISAAEPLALRATIKTAQGEFPFWPDP